MLFLGEASPSRPSVVGRARPSIEKFIHRVSLGPAGQPHMRPQAAGSVNRNELFSAQLIKPPNCKAGGKGGVGEESKELDEQSNLSPKTGYADGYPANHS